MIQEIKPGVFRDHNGNVATVKYWGSEEKAKASLLTLKNCENCSDCLNCRHCSDCRNCWYCSDCRNCRYCENCRNCDNKDDLLNYKGN